MRMAPAAGGRGSTFVVMTSHEISMSNTITTIRDFQGLWAIALFPRGCDQVNSPGSWPCSYSGRRGWTKPNRSRYRLQDVGHVVLTWHAARRSG